MSERFVEADGVDIFLRDHGEGHPVLLLHGFPETGECWRFVAPALAAGHRVLVPDLPGFGRSEAPPSSDARTVARILGEMIEATVGGAVTVVGHDWGGSISFALAVERPDLVSKLVVVNAPFRKLDLKRGFYMVLFNVPVAPEVWFKVAGRQTIRAFLMAGSARRGWIDRDIVRAYADAYRPLERTRSALAYYRTITRKVVMRSFRASDGKEKQRSIGAPTMIAWGMKDPALPPSLLDGIARDIPHAQIERIDGVGHFVPEEAPKELLDRIVPFIDAE